MKTNTIKRRDVLRIATASGLLLPATLSFGQQATVDAQTQFGTVRGMRANGVNVFKGIPYGANTAGDNRFMPPKDPSPWREYREALAYGPAAPQSDPSTGNQQDGNESEDCLVLNVWSTGLDDGGKRPVMFWIHGGGFASLSGSSPGYDGTNLCLRGDVVVVTMNHRLNMMGFANFGEIDSEFSTSGTVGMQDIVHALKWVRNNIESFGGDPDRVMIFGESGGGRKVGVLLGMPEAKGLFHAAMIESGATLRLPERAASNELAHMVLNDLGIDPSDVRAIQQVPLQRLMSAYHTVAAIAPEAGGGAFAPTMDGETIPYHPFWPNASPVNPDVPLVIGANRTEMTLFAAGDEALFSLDEASMRQRAAELVGIDNADSVVSVYQRANPDASPSEIYFLIWSDQSYVMASHTIAERRAALNAAPVYLYYLAWETSINGGRMMSPHSLDIPFMFDNTRINQFTADSETALALADKVSDTVIHFARTGDPNTGKLPEWLPYDAQRRHTMVLNDVSTLETDPLRYRREIMQPILNL